MRVDHRIFLSRPQDVSFEAEQLWGALKDAAARSTDITILSAYHGPSFVGRLLNQVPRASRSECGVTLVFGVDVESTLMSARRELRQLHSGLRRIGFRDLDIKIFRRERPFHTKLYLFHAHRQPTWFVGSANASSAVEGARHELMLRLTGSHPQLRAYVREVIDQAYDISDEQVFVSTNDDRSFFTSGYLCYKPGGRLPFTFEACAIEDAHRRALEARLASGSSIPHAGPKAEGFGFSLMSAAALLGGNALQEAGFAEEKSQAIERLRLRSYAIETVYGFWVPGPYANFIEAKVSQAIRRKASQMKELARLIDAVEWNDWLRELRLHTDALQRVLRDAGLEMKAREPLESRFQAFLGNRREWLADDQRIERLVRPLHIEPMPDLWSAGDPHRFVDSFIEDLTYRLSAPGRKSQIIRIFEEQLELEGELDSDTLRRRLSEWITEGVESDIW